jgi:hypothetical protein
MASFIATLTQCPTTLHVSAACPAWLGECSTHDLQARAEDNQHKRRRLQRADVLHQFWSSGELLGRASDGGVHGEHDAARLTGARPRVTAPLTGRAGVWEAVGA